MNFLSNNEINQIAGGNICYKEIKCVYTSLTNSTAIAGTGTDNAVATASLMKGNSDLCPLIYNYTEGKRVLSTIDHVQVGGAIRNAKSDLIEVDFLANMC